jgi:hypothetical protein
MDIRWYAEYILDIAAQRLGFNRTRYHVENTYFEQIGAAAEMAARIFLGLPAELHVHFDGGVDMRYLGWAIDIKATKLTPNIQYRYLQWQKDKPIKADIIWQWGVDLVNWRALPTGWAYASELFAAPINQGRDRPCHEIAVPDLHPIYELYSLQHPSRYASKIAAPLTVH